ncbi:MAG: hypothetical protein IRY83_02745 [Chloroflexi bacterium]|nr:hypothetical protein [Chloroflexota bacterium]
MPDGRKADTALLVNVGNRDLQLDGQEIRPARERGLELREQFDRYRERLTMPIITPLLAYFEQREEALARVVLFATDQPAEADPGFRSTDTLHFAEIVQRLIQERTKGRLEVVIRLLRDLNPSQYDETYTFYQRDLRGRKVVEGIGRWYVAASGGTPAMNQGLLLAAIERFGDDCQVLYLRQGASLPEPLDLGGQIRQSILRQLARGYLDRYDFAAVQAVLERMPGRELTARLADYGAARLNFDHHGAWQIADAVHALAQGRERLFVQALREEARALRDGDASLLLAELYHKARVCYQNGAYKEFLVFLFALDEYALQEVIRRELGIDMSGDDWKDQERRRKQVAERPELRAFLETRQTDSGEPLRYERATRVALGAYLDFLIERPPAETGVPQERAAELKELRQIDRQLNAPPLARLRNRAVHGTGGASREVITAAYREAAGSERDLLADLEALARIAGGQTTKWRLDTLREYIRDQLGE